jgi:hypothetical protein
MSLLSIHNPGVIPTPDVIPAQAGIHPEITLPPQGGLGSEISTKGATP